MLLLALAGCGKVGPDRIEQVQQAADTADQLMIRMHAYLTKEGVQTAYLEADSAFVYENNGHTDLKNILVTFFTPSGVKTSVLTGETGWYKMRTGEIQARGNVVVVRTDGATLRTSVLHYDQAKNEVSTDQPYTWDEPPEKHLAATGFVSDPTFSNIRTQALHGTAGHFTLPGQ